MPIYLSQRTARHVVKRLDSSYIYSNHFGTFGFEQTDNTGLSFPYGIASDSSGNIFVCDGNNLSIVKLSSTTLSYIDSLDVSSIVGVPISIFYDGTYFYVIGIYINLYISIAKISNSLTVIRFNNNILPTQITYFPSGISLGFNPNELIISGLSSVYKITETLISPYFSASVQAITGESGIKFLSHIKCSDNKIYIIKNRPEGFWLSKINSSYVDEGNSNFISNARCIVGSGLLDTILVFDFNGRVLRFNTSLNLVETIYQHAGDSVELDSKEIYGLTET